MKDIISFVFIYLIVLMLGFAIGFAFRKSQEIDCKDKIISNQCYKYGGNGCE